MPDRKPMGDDRVDPMPHTVGIDADVSVVLSISRHFDTVRLVLEHLAAQTIADRLEIVLLAESDAIEVDESTLAAFAGWQLAVPTDFTSAGNLRAEGVRMARATRVWFAEDHGFPAPGTLEALRRVYDEHDAITGVVMENANPATAISWADMFLNFGPYVGRPELEDLGHLAWHKNMYPRDLLLECDAKLDDFLDVESELQEWIRSRGGRLMIVPDAPLYHLNVSRFDTFVETQAINGRLYGASRSAGWPVWKRLSYAAAFPLILAVRLRRLVAEVVRAGEGKRVPKMLPFLSIGLTVNQFWETVGYVVGARDSRVRKHDAEYRRYRFMTAADCRRIFRDPDGRPPRSLVAGWTSLNGQAGHD
ncbi:MAG: hypothetical protein ACC682_03095 [Gemmatimonadota bacterium]